tara:strand:+ start:3776 stop:4471 length:696 start_codon:yes stop_codon:yes gene_type:complete
MKEIIVISCGPGLDEVKEEYGHSYEWVQQVCLNSDIKFSQVNAYKGDFPNLSDGDGWIITGSAKSVYDDIEWIVELEMLIKKAFDIEKPLLGICFGHQLIAQALGGVVEKNNKGWELGSSFISINDTGMKSPIFKDVLFNDSFYMSHQDVVVQLPAQAIELASNEKGNQSYSIGNYIYGVQFHPEFPYSVTKKYAKIRYDKGLITSNPEVVKSKTSHKIIINFIKNLKGGK